MNYQRLNIEGIMRVCLNLMKKAFFIFVLVLAAVFLITKTYDTVRFKQNSDPLFLLSESIADSCKGVKSRFNCYDDETLKLMDPPRSLSMKEAFEVAKYLQARYYPSCHSLAHRISGKEVQKNPDKWKEVISHCPEGICTSGCVHGAMVQRFNKDSFTKQEIDELVPEFKTICFLNKQASPFEVKSCYHGLGHLVMFTTAGDVHRSLAICDQVSSTTYLSYPCYSGVFMQLFRPFDREDQAVVKEMREKIKDVPSFCKNLAHEKRAVCLIETWQTLVGKESFNPEAAKRFCSEAFDQSDPLTFTCYDYLIGLQINRLLVHPEKAFDYCHRLSNDLTGSCLGLVGSKFIDVGRVHIDKALDLCESAGKYKESCYQSLSQGIIFNLVWGSDEQKNYCDRLPVAYKHFCKPSTTKWF